MIPYPERGGPYSRFGCKDNVSITEERSHAPPNTVSTVRKYELMGITIMAKVKARSLTMTDLGGGYGFSDETRLDMGRGSIRGNGWADVGLFIGRWAGTDPVILLEECLFLGDDSTGGHGGNEMREVRPCCVVRLEKQRERVGRPVQLGSENKTKLLLQYIMEDGL
jgi:hypothetical protein